MLRAKLSILVVLASALTLPWSKVAGAQSLSSNGEVYVNYKMSCDAPTQRLDLGRLTVGLSNTPVMTGDLAVSGAAKASGIWNCMQLHYLQVITYDDCPAKINGKDGPTPIIDSPGGGGWDYEHVNSDQTKPIKPDYAVFFDANGMRSTPWYYGSVGEGMRQYVNPCNAYHIGDMPAYCPNAGDTFFDTFLVATANDPCNNPAVCVQHNEILLLADWTWTISTGGNTLTNILTPGAADVTEITDALTNAGYGNTFTPVINKTVCCPEPGIYALFVGGGVSLLSVRRRRVRIAA